MVLDAGGPELAGQGAAERTRALPMQRTEAGRPPLSGAVSPVADPCTAAIGGPSSPLGAPISGPPSPLGAPISGLRPAGVTVVARSFGPTALATPANAITVARLMAMPLMVLLIVRDGATWPAVAAWFVLSCTDGLDGYLARRHGTTRSGAFLDPLADKFCVLAAMATLVAMGRWWWPAVALIAARELFQTLWRARLGRRGVSVPATPLAKLKTVLQDLAVGSALLPWTAAHPSVVQPILWTAVFLTVLTSVRYLLDGRRVLAAEATTP